MIHSDMSPVNNSDSDLDAIGYFLGIIKWSNKNSSDIFSRDTMH